MHAHYLLGFTSLHGKLFQFLHYFSPFSSTAQESIPTQSHPSLPHLMIHEGPAPFFFIFPTFSFCSYMRQKPSRGTTSYAELLLYPLLTMVELFSCAQLPLFHCITWNLMASTSLLVPACAKQHMYLVSPSSYEPFPCWPSSLYYAFTLLLQLVVVSLLMHFSSPELTLPDPAQQHLPPLGNVVASSHRLPHVVPFPPGTVHLALLLCHSTTYGLLQFAAKLLYRNIVLSKLHSVGLTHSASLSPETPIYRRNSSSSSAFVKPLPPLVPLHCIASVITTSPFSFCLHR